MTQPVSRRILDSLESSIFGAIAIDLFVLSYSYFYLCIYIFISLNNGEKSLINSNSQGCRCGFLLLIFIFIYLFVFLLFPLYPPPKISITFLGNNIQAAYNRLSKDLYIIFKFFNDAILDMNNISFTI